VIDANGQLTGKYRKMHIPDDPNNHYDEAYYFAPGDLGFHSFQMQFAKVGPMICFDQWFPEGARTAAEQGAEILFYRTAIGWPIFSLHHHDIAWFYVAVN
jgi:N-carbamoylputrescine amidase